MAPPQFVGGGMARSDSLAFLDDLVFDNADLPPLIDSPYADGGGLISDFNKVAAAAGASSSSFAAAGTNEAIKAEPQPLRPAVTNNPAAHGSYSYSYQEQQAGEPQAIRRHCKPEAPATLLLSPSRGGEADMFRVDDFLQLDGFTDDYNMWKF